MPELSRVQIAVYGALACVVLLLGARWIRSSDEQAPGPAGTLEPVAAAGGEAFEPRPGDVVVHVAGAVRRPGVYRLPAGSRVTDALRRAGGASGGGDPGAINLAAELSDGQQVVVPAQQRGAAASVGPAPPDGPISLGTATAEQLEAIEGIGPVTAAQIIEFRDQHGVGSIEDLDQISGIGPTTMESLRARLQP